LFEKYTNSTTLGIIFAIALFVFFGYSFYESKKNEKLPLKIKNDLIKLQKQLPIKLSDDISLEDFELKRNSVSINLKLLKDVNSRLPKYEIESRANFFICEWRKNFLNDNSVKLNVIIHDLFNKEIASVKNNKEICSVPFSDNFDQI